MNFADVFSLAGTFAGGLLGVLAALLLGRWLLSAPRSAAEKSSPSEIDGRDRRISRILHALLRR
jgi:hypothetical protein